MLESATSAADDDRMFDHEKLDWSHAVGPGRRYEHEHEYEYEHEHEHERTEREPPRLQVL